MDGDQIVEDFLFCRSVIAGAKVQEMREIYMTLLCVKTTRTGLSALASVQMAVALWKIAGSRKKKITSCTVDPPHNPEGKPCFKAPESSTEPSPGKCVEIGELYKSRPQKTRSCKQLCEDVGSDHMSVLYYCR